DRMAAAPLEVLAARLLLAAEGRRRLGRAGPPLRQLLSVTLVPLPGLLLLPRLLALLGLAGLLGLARLLLGPAAGLLLQPGLLLGLALRLLLRLGLGPGPLLGAAGADGRDP